MNNISEAQTALMTKPVKATTYERVTLLAQMRDRYAGEPQPIRFGYIMRDFLSKVSTPLFSSDLIAGRQADRELSEEEEALYQQFLTTAGISTARRSSIADTRRSTGTRWSKTVLSVCAVRRFSDANEIAKERNLTPYTVMQQRFSYLGIRTDMPPPYKFNEYTTRERLRYLADRKIPLVAYSCLAKGGYALPDRLPEDHVTGNRLTLLSESKKQGCGLSSAALKAFRVTFLRL